LNAKEQGMAQTMKAAAIQAFGGRDVLKLEDVPRPTPAQGEVLLKVHAVGINPIDHKTRQGAGANRRWKETVFPVILGWDVSGVVEESNDPAWQRGDEVFALARYPQPGSGYAEYSAVPAAHLARKPRTLDHVHAAAVPLVALTAWQAIFEKAGLSAGQTILVHAAAGGVGHLAVQLAKWKGAKVIATASGRNEAFVKSLGADQFIDYTGTAFEQVVKDVDVVFHTIGAEFRPRSWKTVKKGGWLVGITGQFPEDEGNAYGARGAFVGVRPDGKVLDEIGVLFDAGKVRVNVDKTYALADIAKAHEHVEGGHTRGKVVVTI
jgi:NADPH:quinone reductase-like Zn-dependent oxidoreductase